MIVSPMFWWLLPESWQSFVILAFCLFVIALVVLAQ